METKTEKLILKKLDSIDGRLDGIDGRLDGIDGRLDGIDGRLDGMDSRLDGMDSRFDGIEENVKENRTLIEFLVENSATKEELHTEIAESETRMMTHIDGFMKLHTNLATEIVAVQSKNQRLEKNIGHIADHIELKLT